jgi:hypothetical protein
MPEITVMVKTAALFEASQGKVVKNLKQLALF